MKIITFCGKLRLKEEMEILASKIETYDDYMCILPFEYQPGYIEGKAFGDNELFECHMEKVKISDGVCIVLPENCSTVAHAGSSTMRELEASIRLHKTILFSSMFPELLYTLQDIEIVDTIDSVVIGDVHGPNVKMFILRYKYIEPKEDK